jgi:hypothetical protein
VFGVAGGPRLSAQYATLANPGESNLVIARIVNVADVQNPERLPVLRIHIEVDTEADHVDEATDIADRIKPALQNSNGPVAPIAVAAAILLARRLAA